MSFLDENGLSHYNDLIENKLAGKVSDVVVNGTSVVNNGTAEIPVASDQTEGVVKVSAGNGITIDQSNNRLAISRATSAQIKTGTDTLKPIVPSNQHESAFYGLAKAAGDTTQSASNNTVGTYTAEAKTAIQNMLGVSDASSVVSDVTIDSSSIVSNGVAEIPMASTTDPGIVIIGSGLALNTSGKLSISRADLSAIKVGTNASNSIVPSTHHYATFYGLAKAAGDSTQSASDNAVGTYTSNAKSAIQTMLNVPDANDVVGDVTVNGTSVVSNGVAEIPNATTTDAGVVTIGSGLTFNSSGKLVINSAGSGTVKTGTNVSEPIVPGRQHESTFYGLAKAAGDSTQSASSNAVGTYTSEAKSAIQTMLNVPDADAVVSDVTINGTSVVSDGVAEIPIATTTDYGLVRPGTGLGLAITSSGSLAVAKANTNQLKGGVHDYSVIVTANQHMATFYGLAKAAGADEANSSLEFGTYTDTAKAAIKNMLGVSGESQTITVSGTAPVITAQPNTRYICGEVLSLDFTPCASGICNVTFTSGSTVTVLNLPQTVKMPEWFEVETNTIYEISIMDGVYGAVMSWAI